jgi:hypothetical protein
MGVGGGEGEGGIDLSNPRCAPLKVLGLQDEDLFFLLL